MNFDGLQTGSVWAGIAALILALGGAGAAGVIKLRDQSWKSTNKSIRRLERQVDAADARTLAIREESDAQEQRLLKRIRNLESTVHVHHDVIRVARLDLSGLLWRDDLNACRQELEKVRDKLDTRIR
jgi:hypothetical protein